VISFLLNILNYNIQIIPLKRAITSVGPGLKVLTPEFIISVTAILIFLLFLWEFGNRFTLTAKCKQDEIKEGLRRNALISVIVGVGGLCLYVYLYNLFVLSLYNDYILLIFYACSFLFLSFGFMKLTMIEYFCNSSTTGTESRIHQRRRN
jgi:hypothetical protein